MMYEAYLRALLRFVARQRDSSIGRVGAAALPWEKQFNAGRWNRELADDLRAVAERPDQASIAIRFNAYIEGQLRDAARYEDRKERVQAVLAVYADLGGRCESLARVLASTGVMQGVELAPDTRRHMLYRLYDEMGGLLYVGITDRGPARLVEHYRNKPWFPLVCRVELERHETRELVEAREIELIRGLHPLFNVQHNRQPRGADLLRPVAIPAKAQRGPASS